MVVKAPAAHSVQPLECLASGCSSCTHCCAFAACALAPAGRWYHFFNEGLQNQDVLYMADAPGGKPKVFFDPNALSSDGTVALGRNAFSDGGAHSLARVTRRAGALVGCDRGARL
jgi:Prolyl oligopeptidase, N-terminal beta-propeller domain